MNFGIHEMVGKLQDLDESSKRAFLRLYKAIRHKQTSDDAKKIAL